MRSIMLCESPKSAARVYAPETLKQLEEMVGLDSAFYTKADVMANPLYVPAFSVEEVNRRVEQGVAFRDAYRQVADEITNGTFRHEATVEETLSHYTHEGSIGNLCNTQIKAKMNAICQSVSLDTISRAINLLLNR